jgi:hypothetical protein
MGEIFVARGEAPGMMKRKEKSSARIDKKSDSIFSDEIEFAYKKSKKRNWGHRGKAPHKTL